MLKFSKIGSVLPLSPLYLILGCSLCMLSLQKIYRSILSHLTRIGWKYFLEHTFLDRNTANIMNLNIPTDLILQRD